MVGELVGHIVCSWELVARYDICRGHYEVVGIRSPSPMAARIRSSTT